MRIAFVTPEYPTEESYSGGLANYLGRISTALRQDGHDIHVFTRSTSASESIEWRGIQVHRVVPLWDQKMRLDRVDRLVPKWCYAAYQDWKAARSLWRCWTRIHVNEPFDIVQLANVQAVGWHFFAQTDVPVVTRLSSYRPAWDLSAGIEPTSGVRLRWWMERKVVRRSPHIYAPTHFVKRLTEENYGVSGIRVIESPFYHEEPVQDPTIYQRYCNGKEYILYFGSHTQMKGVQYLASALPDVMQKNPNMHAVFIGKSSIAPDGSEMHNYVRSRLKSFADRLTILDSLPHTQLYPFVRNARVVALPSVIDNLPNTCLEAMALGRLVVATTGTCFEQLIEDGASGILVSPKCIESLQDGLHRAWRLPKEDRRRIGKAAATRIEMLHPEKKLPELIRYFESIRSAQ